ncbi:Protein CUP-SHAPED COTYLEDON 3 [Heracleum sosnowskyi]|uniref:Protein CUP-SHAPED COTYLEDON 3 n=1 Tax=Heracleum sosnowskyi TaxID=360622 RepID=A0AAD8GUX0_9APIA|nr:Protein CUP-SHAPED COTYLEDON 3 [Heracleum sosnowskyi]
MGLRDIGAALPPGFRFYPSDDELVCHYLYKKIAHEDVSKGTLVDIDLHTCEPWQLPEVAKLNSTEWYFFSFRDRKYATGFRTNRATTSGYWKATGKDRTVVDPNTNCLVGMRKTLVFYKNRAPNGIKSNWIMHEFRLENPLIPFKQEDWVLCRVFYKSKTESNTDQSPQNVYDTKATAGADNFPDAAQIMLPAGCNNNYLHQVISSQSHAVPHHQNPNNLETFSELNPNFLQISNQLHAHRVNEMIMISSKCDEDQYGFVLDMDFEESNIGDGMTWKT